MDHTAFFDKISLFMPLYKISKKNVISLRGLMKYVICFLLFLINGLTQTNLAKGNKIFENKWVFFATIKQK